VPRRGGCAQKQKDKQMEMDRITIEFAWKVINSEVARYRQRGCIRSTHAEDVASAVMVHLVEAWGRYDPSRGPVEAFINQVVTTRLVSVLRERHSRKRGGRARSLGCLGEEPADPAWSHDRWRRLTDLRMDLESVRRRLNPKQHSVCDQLLRDLLAHAAKEMGIPRRTLRDNVAKIRRIFRDAGLEEYF
jgi:RNA polymerase sigma factor (sigma-70 family)